MLTAAKLPRQLGRYDVVGRLAVGGMAEILLARLTGPSGFERAVVLKRILPHLASERAFVEMFLDEGRLAAGIRHPNVVQVQELALEDGELYLVMEYLEGEALANLMRRLRARGRALDPALCAYVVAEAAAGLHAAHELRAPDGGELGLVHRDVSPQNVFVGYDGTVKVLDFGIAKASDRLTKTDAGALKGKFDYMSPEQANGEPLDRRTDVFALGIVLYELATGRRLFKRATHMASLRAVTSEPVAPASSVEPTVGETLSAIAMKALERDPSRRFATAQEMRRALMQSLREMSAPATPDEALAALMRELFEGRIAEKRELLARMREGVTPSLVPEAEVDTEIEIPAVDASVVRSRSAIGELPRRRSRLGLGAAIAVALGAIAVAAYFAWPRPAPVAAEVERAPIAAAPATVTLTIDSEPRGAEVLLDGEPRGVTPLELRVARSSAAASFSLELDGHETVRDVITPDVDQRVRLTLAALPEPAPLPAKVRRPRRAPAPRASEPPPERTFRHW